MQCMFDSCFPKDGFGYTTDSMLAASQQQPTNGAPIKTGLPIKLQIINLLHAVRTLLRSFVISF